MGKFTLTHEIRTDQDTFWKVFFEPEYNQRLFLERLGFPDFQVLENVETDTTIRRKIAAQPKMNVPAPVVKLLGANFRYTEEGVFDKATRAWRWKMTPSTLADKMRTEGVIRTEPLDAGTVRRIAEVTIEVKVFGVGGLIEASAEKQVRESMDASAAFMQLYLVER